MSDFAERLVTEIRSILGRVRNHITSANEAAKALDGVASAMDGSVPGAVRHASRRLANDVELLAHGGTSETIDEISARFEAAVGTAGSRHIREC